VSIVSLRRPAENERQDAIITPHNCEHFSSAPPGPILGSAVKICTAAGSITTPGRGLIAFDHVFVIDDGSPVMPDDPRVQIKHEGEWPGTLPRIAVYRHEQRLGRSRHVSLSGLVAQLFPLARLRPPLRLRESSCIRVRCARALVVLLKHFFFAGLQRAPGPALIHPQRERRPLPGTPPSFRRGTCLQRPDLDLRNLITPPACWSAMGPLACLPSGARLRAYALSVTVNRPPFAVMSYVFHLPAALMTVGDFAMPTMAPVA